MKEVRSHDGSEAATLAACVATILELDLDAVPQAPPGEDVAAWRIMRWLGGRGLGLVPVDDAASFSWAGPWIGWVRTAGGERAAVVMYGVPSGVVWDPSGATERDGWRLEAGHVIAAQDVALAPPPLPEAPLSIGTVEAIFVAGAAGAPPEALQSARALVDQGLEGDRHVDGTGTFPSGLPGSALTLIEAEVCESFAPALDAAEHRRNVVTRGIDLNALVGHDFVLGDVRCRGMRLCEPCMVLQRYASRPVLRPLVHRGGLRADILEDGVVSVGDEVRALGQPADAESHIAEVGARVRAIAPDDLRERLVAVAQAHEERDPKRLRATLGDDTEIALAFGEVWRVEGDAAMDAYLERHREHLRALLLFELAHEGAATAAMRTAAERAGIGADFAAAERALGS